MLSGCSHFHVFMWVRFSKWTYCTCPEFSPWLYFCVFFCPESPVFHLLLLHHSSSHDSILGPSRNTPHCSNGRIFLYWIAGKRIFSSISICADMRSYEWIVGLLFKKGEIPTVGKVPTIKISSDKSFYRQFLQLESQCDFQTVALEACLYWDEFDIKGLHWMKKFPEKNSAMLCQSMRL